ncbi:hypothetical protein FACS1894184_00870 [Clostridia bacterium]|nr:hypothetical protein FACS1894184_00870 [Clostridia bacterium]
MNTRVLRYWLNRLQNRYKRLGAVLVIALVIMPALSAAAEVTVFPQSGVRLETASSETVITPQTLSDQSEWLSAQGFNPDALAASYYAEHVLFEVMLDNGARVTFSQREWIGVDSVDDRASLEPFTIFADSFEWLDGGWLRTVNAYESIYQIKDTAIKSGKLIEICARAPNQASADPARLTVESLESIKSRITFTDKRQLTQPLSNTKPEYTLTLLSGIARTVESSGALDFNLTELPAWTEGGGIIAKGTTQPGAFVTLAVDGQEISKTKADADGSFAFEFELTGENCEHEITLNASHGGAEARRVYSALLARDITPLVVSPSIDPITEPFDLYVYTLPDAAIELVTPSRTMRGPANGSGYLYFSLSIRRGQSSAYKVTATASGRQPTTMELTLQRELSEAELVQDFRANTQSITYKRLTDNPSAVSGKNVELRGRVGAVMERDGLPALVLYITNTGSGSWNDPVFVHCNQLLQFANGDLLTVLGTVRGEAESVDGETMPAIDGMFYLR